MKNVILHIIIISISIFLIGCGNHNEQNFTIVADGHGNIVRLNTITGETCVVDKSCKIKSNKSASELIPIEQVINPVVESTELIINEHYIYKGDGKFEHTKVIKFEDFVE